MASMTQAQGRAAARVSAEPSGMGKPVRERGAGLPIALLVVAFALLLVPLWTSLVDTSEQAVASIPSRLVLVATCFAAAFCFRSHVPSVQRVCWVASTLFFARLVLSLVGSSLAAGSDVAQVVQVVSLVCGKVGAALFFMLMCQVAAAFDRRVCAVGLPLGFLIAEILFCLSVFVVPDMLLTAASLACWPLCAVLMLVCVHICSGKRPPRGMQPLQRGFASAQGRTFLFLENPTEWVLLILGTTLFPLLFCVASQLCLVGGGDGLYDPPNEMAALCGIVVLAVYGHFASERLSYGRMLARCVPFLACGFALLPWFGGTNGLLGQILIKLGFIGYQVMFWVLLVCKVRDDPRHAYLYTGLFLGLFMLSKTIGRAVVFAPDPGVQTALLSWQVAVAALWIVCIYTLAFYVAVLWGALRPGLPVRAGTAASDGADEGQLAEPADSFVLKFDAFCGEYGLSPREREVLELAVHGYTMVSIARELVISDETVKTHLRRIYAKVGVSGKQRLIEAVEAFEPGAGKNPPCENKTPAQMCQEKNS